MHALFSTQMTNEMIRTRCRTADILCADCKALAAGSINLHLFPIRERREALEKNPDQLWSILEQGGTRAATRAEVTMEQVRAVTGLSRNRPAIASSDRRAYSASEASRSGHDLSTHTAWLDQETNLRAKNVREYWLANIVPAEIRLTQDTEQVYITGKKKRVYVNVARMGEDGSWGFEIKPKTYELLSLLCWDDHNILHDFIIPQIAFQAPWTAHKKTIGKNEITVLRVQNEGARFLLKVPNAEPIEITQYRGEYTPMN